MAYYAEVLYANTLFGLESDYDTGSVGIAMMTNGELTGEPVKGKDYAQVENGCIHAEIELEGITVSVYEVHLNYARSDWRAQQLYHMAMEIAEDTCDYIIVAGDFNLRDFDELDVLAGFTAVNTDESYYPTYHGLDWPTQAIDNILYTGDTLKLESVEMPVNGLSDHNAIVAKFSVR